VAVFMDMAKAVAFDGGSEEPCQQKCQKLHLAFVSTGSTAA
jgi:hypothetical protein